MTRNRVMREGSLFSGYNGLGLGVKAALERYGVEVQPAWFVEFDAAPSKILAHQYPNVTNLGDITAVNWSSVEPVDALTGGFPCQDVSLAGARRGIRDGTRSGLWAHFATAIRELRPQLVVIENVRGLLSAKAGDHEEITDDEGWTDEEIDALEAARGSTIAGDIEPGPVGVGEPAWPNGPVLNAFGSVLLDLALLGFDAEWVGVRASDAGAPHQRFRVFIVATPIPDAQGDGRGEGWAESARVQGRPDDELRGSGTADAVVDHLPTVVAHDSGNSVEAHLRKKPGRTQVTSLQVVAEHLLPTVGGDLLLPTVTTAIATGGNARRGGNRSDELLLPGVLALMPTPVVTDAEGARNSTSGRTEGSTHHSGQTMTDVVETLPTPQAHDAVQGKTPEQVAAMRARGHGVSNLNEVAPLLPTVTVQDASNTGGASQFGRNTLPLNTEVMTLVRPELNPVEEYEALWDALDDQSPFWRTDKANYWPAIERWTRVMGRKAPAPTIPDGKHGRFRLNPKFTEWMMGVPLGWITDCGLTRNEALKACGNGVVWQQAALAMSILLPRIQWRLAA